MNSLQRDFVFFRPPSTASQETAFLYLKNQYVTSIEKYNKLRQTAAVSW
jgi:hypothetical protein